MCPTGASLKPKDMATTTCKDFKLAFDVLDVDHDGKISCEDLKMFYARYGKNSSGDDEAIKAMISAADFNKDGYIEYDEFERVLTYGGKRHGGGCGGVMEEVFRIMDKDGDGRLSVNDLKSYMKRAGFNASDEDIKAMIKVGGGDEFEGVSFDGLLKILAVDQIGWSTF
ncbi:calcium-binding protein CP1 [Mangifera indica]|uniref:calcium-binding protein CP1 n=1 Tax=Mangifera indica TaxID=29780 RepID=UPI001CFB8B72|nr:calcium-binding protein CP1 [Mangifera indica]